MMVKVMVIRGENTKQQRCSPYPEEREWEEECCREEGWEKVQGGGQGGLRSTKVAWKECRGRMGGRKSLKRVKLIGPERWQWKNEGGQVGANIRTPG